LETTSEVPKRVDVGDGVQAIVYAVSGDEERGQRQKGVEAASSSKLQMYSYGILPKPGTANIQHPTAAPGQDNQGRFWMQGITISSN